jgi:hypothetical protein
VVMSSVFVASQSTCFFLCSREQIDKFSDLKTINISKETKSLSPQLETACQN